LAYIYLNGRGVEKNEAKAFEMNLKMAKQGNLRAMLSAGIQLRDGQGTTRSYEQAWNLLNQVRLISPDRQLHWKAVAALDQIKEELGVDKSYLIDRLSYPDWNVVEKAMRRKK
jgi:TPR repeat protein